jgi:hypothetical protein
MMSEQWAPGWSNAVFSLEECDRRWARVRSLMALESSRTHQTCEMSNQVAMPV